MKRVLVSPACWAWAGAGIVFNGHFLGEVFVARQALHDCNANSLSLLLGFLSTCVVTALVYMEVRRPAHRWQRRIVLLSAPIALGVLQFLVIQESYKAAKRATERGNLTVIYDALVQYARKHDGQLPDSLAATADGSMPGTLLPSQTFFWPHTEGEASLERLARGDIDFVYVNGNTRIDLRKGEHVPSRQHLNPRPFRPHYGAIDENDPVVLHSKPRLLHQWANVVHASGIITTVYLPWDSQDVLGIEAALRDRHRARVTGE